MNKLEFRIMTDEEQAENDAAYEAIGGDMALYGYDTKNPPKHAGLYFRGINNVYYQDMALQQRKGYRLLKRRSCKGCPTCDFIFEELNMDASNVTDIGEVKHGQLYELRIGPSYQCPISGEWSAPEITFEEVKEEEKGK